MTPARARELLDGNAAPAPWDYQTYGNGESADITAPIGPAGLPYPIAATEPRYAPIIAAAPDMANFIAGMTVEYRGEFQIGPGPQWGKFYLTRDGETWSRDRKTVEAALADCQREYPGSRCRIVRRYVTEPEAVE